MGIESIKFNAFMDGSWRSRRAKKNTMFAAVSTLSLYVYAHPAKAAAESIISSTLSHKIMNAFDPIIQMVQGSAYPIGFIMMSGGFILIMMGQTTRGKSLIKWAILGYLGLQFAPAIMQIVADIGAQLKP